MKYSLIYSRPWWRDNGYLGRIIFLNSSAPNIYTHNCIDNSPYSWSRGVVTCFTEGGQNRAFLRLTESQRRQAMEQIVREALGETSEPVLGTLEKNWADDEFSRGAYNVFFPPGVLSNFWPEIRSIWMHNQLVPGIWLCGADYSLTSQGYINGAIQTGQEAARRAVDEISSATTSLVV